MTSRSYFPSPVTPALPVDPCRPNPCGANSQCNVAADRAVCSCLPGFIDRPPNCRPECVVHQDCRADQACIGQKCRDPCPGSCGAGADCLVRNHNPICSCPSGYTGDPFTQCTPRPQSEYRAAVTGERLNRTNASRHSLNTETEQLLLV